MKEEGTARALLEDSLIEVIRLQNAVLRRDLGALIIERDALLVRLAVAEPALMRERFAAAETALLDDGIRLAQQLGQAQAARRRTAATRAAIKSASESLEPSSIGAVKTKAIANKVDLTPKTVRLHRKPLGSKDSKKK